MHGEAGLGELVEDYISRQLRLFVYNQEYGITRLVTIIPSRSWGGEGALGCVLGFGALHRLPAPLTEGPVAGPGEALFESVRVSREGGRPVSPYKETAGYNMNAQQLSSNVIVPATLTSAPPLRAATGSPQGAGPPKGGRRAKKAVSPSVAFDEYFKEGEQKSKEEDFAPTSKSPAPPPPSSLKSPPNVANSEGKVDSDVPSEKSAE